MKRWILISICAAAIGCAQEDYVTSEEVQAAIDAALPKCVPGRTIDCPCPGGPSGTQTCSADGRTYSDCACPPVVDLDGGDTPGQQIVMCPDAGGNVKALYPGKKATELFGVMVYTHDPGAMPGKPAFSTVGGNFADGYVLAGCPGDFDVFVGP